MLYSTWYLYQNSLSCITACRSCWSLSCKLSCGAAFNCLKSTNLIQLILSPPKSVYSISFFDHISARLNLLLNLNISGWLSNIVPSMKTDRVSLGYLLKKTFRWDYNSCCALTTKYQFIKLILRPMIAWSLFVFVITNINWIKKCLF